MEISLTAAQAVLIAAAAPLLAGYIKKVKNTIRMRRGAPLLQPYFNLSKLLGKEEEVIPEYSSWLFRAAPYAVLASSVAALLPIPLFGGAASAAGLGDTIAVLFILAIGRFFTALAGMEAGSAFGGMGSSREMFISGLAEPAALIAFFVLSLKAGSTSFYAISSAGGVNASSLIAGLSLFIVALAETSRIPVDNQETHLELTMVHEAMILEYSGRSLAVMEYAAQLRQMVWFCLIAAVIFPLNRLPGGGAEWTAAAAALFAAKLLALSSTVAVIEVSMAKIRLFRVADLLTFAFIGSLVSAVLAAGGY